MVFLRTLLFTTQTVQRLFVFDGKVKTRESNKKCDARHVFSIAFLLFISKIFSK